MTSNIVLEFSSLEQSSKWKNLPPPPGFDNLHTVTKTSTASAPNNKKALTVKEKAAKYEELKGKRAWDTAIAPAKQLPMQLMMVYFSGGGVQIFSIGMVAMLLSAPFRAFSGINDAFAPFAPSNASNPRSFDALFVQKIVFILCNCLALLVGAWKCHQMGLLPVGTGDWLAFEPRGQSPDISFQ